MPEKPSKSDTGIDSSGSNSNASLSTRLINLLPAFHCILIGIAVSLASWRFFITDSTDRYKCHALLNDGEWLDAGLSMPGSSLTNWQPDGCMLHSYSPKTVAPCLNGRKIVVTGDSVARELYWGFMKVLDPTFVVPTGAAAEAAKHSDFTNLVAGVDAEFIWDPYANATKTLELLQGQAGTEGQRPALLVVSTGLWYLRQPTSGGISTWQKAVDRVFEATHPKHRAVADEVVLLPVEETINSMLSAERRASLTPEGEAQMNAYLRSRLPPFTSSSISELSIPYVFNSMTGGDYLPLAKKHTEDGLHFDNGIMKTQANILLNLRCNDVLPKKFTFDKTCCNQYPAPNWVQAAVILVVLIWGPLGTHYFASKGKPFYSALFPPPQYLTALTVFGFSIIFMYFTDRTSLFLKIQKQFDFWQFTIAMSAALVLGVVTCKKPEKDLGFLNRDQTDEWKGWMQIAILIYHYYGASKVSGIYNPIRVCVAAYLFMSGYGHFFFYYKKADYGFARVAAVLVRLNLLTIVLAYTQDTDYLSYYFSPLVTLWFGVIWVTMYVGHAYNKRVLFMLAKIVISAICMTLFHWIPRPLNTLFGVFNTVFSTSWNAKEWSFRVTLDMFIVYVGMLAALVYIKITEEKMWERQWWGQAKKISIGISAVAMLWFFWFELRLNKFVYNTWHPYTSCIPVLAFIVLRNATPFLRSTSSRAYIWIGQCSLETFICQFHVWLAGDTKGLLVLLPTPRLRFVNMVFTTLIFLFLSNQIARVTGELTEWLLAAPKKGAPLPSAANGGAGYIPLSTMNGGEANDGDAMAATKQSGPSRWEKLMTRLPARAAAFMIAIWIINVLYPTEHPPQGHLLPTH